GLPGGSGGMESPRGLAGSSPLASTVETAAATVLPLAKGAYSLVFMDEQTLYAARDPHGFRPLVLGRLATGWVVASETAALDIVGARFVREIEPGELVCIDGRGVRSRRFAPARPSGCLFEYVYLVRVAAPPVRWPCFYGIDFATRAELIAGQLSPEEIYASIGADSLGYVSLAGLIEATTLPENRLCRACFDGQYPVPVAEGDRGKHVLDGLGVGS